MLTAKILKANGEVDYRSMYCELTATKVCNSAQVSRRTEFDVSIMDCYGPETALDNFPDLAIPDTPELNLFDDIDIEGQDKEWVKRWHAFIRMDECSANGVDDKDPIPSLGIDVSLPTPEFGDNYIHSSVMLPRSNSFSWGTVIGRKRDACDNAIGHAKDNLILDSCVYCMEFNNSNVSELTTNVITELMYALCYKDGNKYLLMDTIIDHKSNALAVSKDDQHMVHRGRNSLRRSTAGWHLCIQWKDGLTSW